MDRRSFLRAAVAIPVVGAAAKSLAVDDKDQKKSEMTLERHIPLHRQEAFLLHTADVVFYGGRCSRYCGKTFALLMSFLKYKDIRCFRATLFRRQYQQIICPGGLWDSSKELYTGLATPLLNPPRWTFPSGPTGATISFEHLDDDKTLHGYRSAQIPLLMFDQLEEFTETQWWYLFSRNRSTCGVRPYIRATCNPDAESWLSGFLSWWIDRNGCPIMGRAGKTRWMARDGEKIVWGNTAENVQAVLGPETLPKSVAFIPT